MRYPLEPLLDALGGPPMAALARRCHVDRRQTYRWRNDGLSDEHADRVAVTIGLHPAIVWPEARGGPRFGGDRHALLGRLGAVRMAEALALAGAGATPDARIERFDLGEAGGEALVADAAALAHGHRRGDRLAAAREELLDA